MRTGHGSNAMSSNLRLRWLSVLAPFALLGACTVESTDGGGTAGVGNTGSVIPMGQGGSAGQSGGSPSTPVAGTAPISTGGNLALGGAPVGTGGAATAGVGNTAGTSSSAGNAGTGAGGMSGGANTHQPTAGCMKQSLDEPGKDVLHNIMVKGVARRYWTKLPTGYSSTKPTPLVFYGP